MKAIAKASYAIVFLATLFMLLLFAVNAPSAWGEETAEDVSEEATEEFVGPVLSGEEEQPVGQADDALTISEEWTQSGTCEWMFDDSTKTITVRPINNAEYGSLVVRNSMIHIWSDYRDIVKKIVFQKTTSISDCVGLFRDFKSLEEIEGLNKVNTRLATSMKDMFYGCSLLSSADFSSFNTSSVTSMYGMFEGCRSITSLDLTSFDTSSVTDFSRMFDHCSALETVNVTSFNVANATLYGMFRSCASLKTIDFSSFVTSGSGSYLLDGCTSLMQIAIGDGYTLWEEFPEGSWVNESGKSFMKYSIPANTAGVYTLVTASPGWNAFGTCEWLIDSVGCLTIRPVNNGANGSLPVLPEAEHGLDNSPFPWIGERAFTNKPTDMAKQIKSVSIEGNVKASNSLERMFEGCINLKQIRGLSNLETSSVKTMRGMFYECASLNDIDLSSFDTSNVEDMSFMFAGADDSDLGSPGVGSKTLDLSSFDTSKVKTMRGMFWRCSKLERLDISMLDTSNVERMDFMFSRCSSLIDLQLDTIDTSKVEYMHGMFRGCSSLSSLEVSSFDTSNVRVMSAMFAWCSSLKTLDLSSFITSSLQEVGSLMDPEIMITGMFVGCTSLEHLNLSSFDTSSVTKSDYIFAECDALCEITVGEKFTLQKKFPQVKWTNTKGQQFYPADIPVGVADTYTSTAPHVSIKVPSGASTALDAGATLQLSVDVLPSSLASSLAWSSSNAAVASVDSSGKVSAKTAGTATITAKAGDLSDSVTVTVKATGTPEVAVESITLDKTSMALAGQEMRTITASVLPANATYKSVVWSSSDESVVRVSAQGSVTATGKGSATITARSADGKKSATCKVTVSNPVTWAGLSATPTKVYVSKSYDVSLSSRGDLPGETDGFTSVAWSSSDASIAGVSGSGTEGSITGVAPGSCTLQVSAVRDGKTFDIAEPIQVEWDLIERITLSEASKSVEVGSPSFTLNYAISNPSAAGRLGEVKWSSISIAEVKGSDGTLTITPKRAGHEVIRFWGPGHSAQASFELTITPKVVEATEDSDVEGYMHINDSEAVDLVGSNRLRILESEDKLEPDVVKLAVSSAGEASFMVDAYDIDLVDDAGNVVPWDEPDHALSIFTKMNDPMKQLSATHDLGVHYVDALSNKAEAKSTWVEGENLAFQTTHFSTYAITATERPVEVTQPPVKNDANTGGLAQTGDTTGTVLLLLLGMAASAAGIVIINRRMRKVL